MKANSLAAVAVVIAALGAVSCVGPRVAPTNQPPRGSVPRPTSRPAPLPPPPPAASWIDRPATPGDWRWSMAGGQSMASFANGRLVMRCNRATATVRIERSEPGATVSGQTTLTIRTQSRAQALAANVQGGSVTLGLPARDPLLDAMAFTKGRFAVEVAGLPTLYVPSWTEVSRVIEDCR